MTADEHQDKPEEPDENEWIKKRHHPRKSFRLRVKMTHDQFTREHQARDISLGGIFVETNEKFGPGEKVGLTLPFANQDRSLKMNGEVVRITDNGVGVKFDIYAIDIE